MQRKVAGSVLTCVLVLSAAGFRAPTSVAGSLVAFVNVNVVSMDPADPKVRKRMTVIVEDGVITTIGPARKTDVPADAEVVNGKGKYLLPGLNDMHLHIRQIRGLPEKFEPEDLYAILLASGITGIFDPWGFPEAFKWQRDLDRGNVVGPRFRFASPGIDEDEYPNAKAIGSDVKKFARQGYEWIKSHDLRTEDAFDAIFEAAAKAGVPVIGHALRPGFAITDTLDRDPLMIAHVEEILSTTPHDTRLSANQFTDAASQVAAARTWVATTIVTYAIIAATVDDDLFAELPNLPGMEFLPPTVELLWTTQNPYRDPGFLKDRGHWLAELRNMQDIVKELKKNGHLDRLLIGTDAGGPPFVVPGASLHDEMRLLNKSGLSALDVIAMSTVNPAAFFQESDAAGTVGVGKRADLILVNKNPTRKIANLANLAGTMVRGVWLSKGVLQERLDELRERWESS